MRKQSLEIKRGGGPFQNVDIQFWLHLYVHTSQPSTLLPFAASPTPGCYYIRVSKHSLGSLLLCNTAAATRSRIRDFQVGASLAKATWREAAHLDSHWQQNRGRKHGLAGGGFNSHFGNWLWFLPKTASSRVQTALPQICQHLIAASVPWKMGFCGAIAHGVRLQKGTTCNVHAHIS